jgi:hypothetical protein
MKLVVNKGVAFYTEPINLFRLLVVEMVGLRLAFMPTLLTSIRSYNPARFDFIFNNHVRSPLQRMSGGPFLVSLFGASGIIFISASGYKSGLIKLSFFRIESIPLILIFATLLRVVFSILRSVGEFRFDIFSVIMNGPIRYARLTFPTIWVEVFLRFVF